MVARLGNTLQSLEDIACLGRRNDALGIGWQQQSIGDKLIRCSGDGINTSLVIAVTLLQRQSRVAACHAVSLGFGESEKAARQVAQIALAEPGGTIIPRHIGADRGAYCECPGD